MDDQQSDVSSLTSYTGTTSKEGDVDWWQLTFRDEKKQRKFSRFRLVNSHNQFPFYFYFTWTVFVTGLGGVLFLDSIDVYHNSYDVLLSYNYVSISVLVNYAVLFFRSKAGVAYLGQFYRKLDDALIWRNFLEECACFIRLTSQLIIFALRCSRGQCPENEDRMLKLIQCNPLATSASVPIDNLIPIFCWFLMERYFFTSTRLSTVLIHWVILCVSLVIIYLIVFIKGADSLTDPKGAIVKGVAPFIFVMIGTFGIGPLCYYIEKMGLVSYLLATRRDGEDGENDHIINEHFVSFVSDANCQNFEEEVGNNARADGMSGRRGESANLEFQNYHDDEADMAVESGGNTKSKLKARSSDDIMQAFGVGHIYPDLARNGAYSSGNAHSRGGQGGGGGGGGGRDGGSTGLKNSVFSKRNIYSSDGGVDFNSAVLSSH